MSRPQWLGGQTQPLLPTHSPTAFWALSPPEGLRAQPSCTRSHEGSHGFPREEGRVTRSPRGQEGWGSWEQETRPLRKAPGPHLSPQADLLPWGAWSRALQRRKLEMGPCPGQGPADPEGRGPLSGLPCSAFQLAGCACPCPLPQRLPGSLPSSSWSLPTAGSQEDKWLSESPSEIHLDCFPERLSRE